ncbi:NAD-dependent glycerol-3-phosphate dehydrogenase [Atractiella rhizophila]|nr:NAD-dependent glycerol-3-phosphate dehydrogenase [Atractiella rhizophila]
MGESKILVFGSGNFGSCLASHLSDLPTAPTIKIWSRDAATVESLNQKHKNPKYLKDHTFRDNVVAVGPELPEKEELMQCDVWIWAVPMQGARKVMEQVRQKIGDVEVPTSVYVAKGIETDTHLLPIQVISQSLGKDAARNAVFLSGPSFAQEIMNRQPTQVTISSFSSAHARQVAGLFHQPHFMCYIHPDPIGVEIAGALKNVYAIASGAAEGLGYGANTRAGLVTRALAEMTRIGVRMGAEPLTFLSLAGVGDLFLTCSSEKSRNFTVGRRLGSGEKLDHILATLGSVAEGVQTCLGAHQIITKLGIQAPIAEAVYSALHEGGTVTDLASYLQSFPVMRELALDDRDRSGNGGNGNGGGNGETMNIKEELGL